MNRFKGHFSAFAGSLLLCAIAPANAGVVEDWNARAIACATRAGPTVTLDIALMHLAVHDAVQGAEGRFAPYAVRMTPGTAVTLPGVVAGAAWGVLGDTRICAGGTAAFDAARAAALAAYNAALAADPAGTAFGYSVGQQMVAQEYRAVPNPAPGYTPVPGDGEWQTTPITNSPFAFVYLATTKPYALNRPSQFRPPPPPPLNSQRYKRELEEVYLRGGASSHPTTVDCASTDPAQTTADLARFWSGNFVAQWNQVARDLSNARITTIGDAARFFALVNMAGADGGIAVWDSKLKYHFWRPETAIYAGGDTAWSPFIRGPSAHFPQTPTSQTPAYPDYVSGANGLTAAMLGMMRAYFRTDRISYSVNRAVPPVVTICRNPRTFTSFSGGMEEVVDARILLGIHFRSADEQARRLGVRVAHWTITKELKPLPPGKNNGKGNGG